MRLQPYLDKRSAQVKNPVMDFLFEYYSFRPSLLARWSPGAGIGLEGATPEEIGLKTAWLEDAGVLRMDPAVPVHRVEPLKWLISLLELTNGRAPRLGCNGLHEWAMVYKTEKRHRLVPLRLADTDLEAFVEKSAIRCTHYDAFRFFSDAAKPLNRFQPERNTVQEMEQPGCLHTNMDLYKWSYKFYPWVGSDLIFACFELAADIRTLDMQASPYDLRAHGLEPVCIETAEGQQEYAERQEAFYGRGLALRSGLLEALKRLETLQPEHRAATVS